MTPGLKFSSAEGEAASSAGRSSSPHRIRRKAMSREMGKPVRTSRSSAALGEPRSRAAGRMKVGVTMFSPARGTILEIIHQPPLRRVIGDPRHDNVSSRDRNLTTQDGPESNRIPESDGKLRDGGDHHYPRSGR